MNQGSVAYPQTDDSTDATTTSDDHEYLPTPILFIFGCCAVGAASRTILKKIPQLPYTVALLVCGFMFGLASNHVDVLRDYSSMAFMDPHTILYVFLPVLLFESAYAMEAHTFLKSFFQIVLLAVPGLGLASVLTAVFCLNVYSYEWDWYTAMMFGSLISATDPVAVVALLKELGASKQLAIVLEGESLLNDGAAIVLFGVFNNLATPGITMSGTDIFVEFVTKVLGGPLFGFIMGRITIFWLVNIFNDALTEITITLASTYMTFYIGEGLLKTSGVLAVVVLGVTISSNRTSISPEVETFLHRFWEMLAYLANTLIFILVGLVIAVKTAAHVTVKDVVLIMALYCALTVIRGIVILVFSPALKRIGYGLTWRNSTMMIWGGLRGAVGLTLALVVVQNNALDNTGTTQNLILLHTAGIVFLTLLLNATTVQPLLNILGMSEVSVPKRMAMASAVRALNEVVTTSTRLYKTDRFLADSDWDFVAKFTVVNDPYSTSNAEADLDQLSTFERHSKCPNCTTDVPSEPSPMEWREMRAEARLRLLKAEKISYWKQFEHGMLSREAVRKLTDLVDSAADSDTNLVNTEEVMKSWEIKGWYGYVRQKLQKWVSSKQDIETRIPVPKQKARRFFYRVTSHAVFEVVLYILIFSNIVSIIYELVEDGRLCPDEFEAKYGKNFSIINYTFISLYTVEVFVKLMAYGKRYFRSKWNLFDFLIVMLSYLDIIIDVTVFKGQVDNSCGGTDASTILSPGILKIAKGIRLLRLLRSLRLIKGIIPQCIDVVDHQINKQLRFGYDVGKGYVNGEEEVQVFLNLMIDNKTIADEFKNRLAEGRLAIIKELALLQKIHPGVAVSIKTQQAARRILNNLQDKVLEMKGEGVLDETESEKLLVMLEIPIKLLLKIPPAIKPPPAEKIIGNLSWVQGDETLIEYIKHNASLVSLADGETLSVESDPKGGIYVIISGLVKVDKCVETFTQSLAVPGRSQTTESELVSDLMTTGSVLGELALLTGKPSNITITCETSTRLFHIPYEAIQAALELFVDEPSLEFRLWKLCAIRVATGLLKNMSHYVAFSQDKLRLMMDKCILCIEKAEMPEGGKPVEMQVFDIRELEEMSDVVLILGVVENYTTGKVYKGPCIIPYNVDKLILIPGQTEKHVIFILPRETSMGDNLAMISEVADFHHSPTAPSQHMANISHASMTRVFSFVGGNRESRSNLCLSHAAKERSVLNKRISDIKLQDKSSQGSLRNRLLGRKKTSSDEVIQDHHIEDVKLIRSDLALQDRVEVVVDARPKAKQAKTVVPTPRGNMLEDDKKAALPPLSNKPVGPLISDSSIPNPPAARPSQLPSTANQQNTNGNNVCGIAPQPSSLQTGTDKVPPQQLTDPTTRNKIVDWDDPLIQNSDTKQKIVSERPDKEKSDMTMKLDSGKSSGNLNSGKKSPVFLRDNIDSDTVLANVAESAKRQVEYRSPVRIRNVKPRVTGLDTSEPVRHGATSPGRGTAVAVEPAGTLRGGRSLTPVGEPQLHLD